LLRHLVIKWTRRDQFCRPLDLVTLGSPRTDYRYSHARILL